MVVEFCLEDGKWHYAKLRWALDFESVHNGINKNRFVQAEAVLAKNI